MTLPQTQPMPLPRMAAVMLAVASAAIASMAGPSKILAQTEQAPSNGATGEGSGGTDKSDWTTSGTPRTISGRMGEKGKPRTPGIGTIHGSTMVWTWDNGLKQAIELLGITKDDDHFLPILKIGRITDEPGLAPKNDAGSANKPDVSAADANRKNTVAAGAGASQTQSHATAAIPDDETKTVLLRSGNMIIELPEDEPLAKLLADPTRAIRILFAASVNSRAWETARMQKLLDAYTTSPSADSVYQVFGRNQTAIGTLAPLYRKESIAGLYFGANDSVAIDAMEMARGTPFRHLYTHEFAHVLQRRYGAQLARTWCNVPAVKDKETYGYKKPLEQQAEALSYAFRYLQHTRTGGATGTLPVNDTQNLARIEENTPGTRLMVALLLTHPAMADHPFNKEGATGRPTLPKLAITWKWETPTPTTAQEREENIRILQKNGARQRSCAGTPAKMR